MRALVLSGGGAKGCFQVGALDYLINEEGLDFNIICGVSVGALNGAMIAQGDIMGLKDIWTNIKSADDIYEERAFGLLGAALGKDSLYNNAPLEKLINRYVDQQKIIDSGRMLRIGVVSLHDGNYYSISETHSSLKKLILASATIPIAFSPINVSHDLMSMVDGGVRNITPLKEAIDLGADEIYVVLCTPAKLLKVKRDFGNVKEIAFRTLEILTNEVYNNDIDTCLEYNLRPDKRKITLHIIRPDTEICDTLAFDPDTLQQGMDAGFEKGRAVLNV